MPCEACTDSARSQHCGAYHFDCIACMSRLIANARPSKAMQERQIAALRHHHKAKWPELWPHIQNQLKKPNHALPQT